MTRKLQNMNTATKMVVKRAKKRMKKRLRLERTWRAPTPLPPLATLQEARKVRKAKAKARRGKRRNHG